MTWIIATMWLLARVIMAEAQLLWNYMARTKVMVAGRTLGPSYLGMYSLKKCPVICVCVWVRVEANTWPGGMGWWSACPTVSRPPVWGSSPHPINSPVIHSNMHQFAFFSHEIESKWHGSCCDCEMRKCEGRPWGCPSLMRPISPPHRKSQP